MALISNIKTDSKDLVDSSKSWFPGMPKVGKYIQLFANLYSMRCLKLMQGLVNLSEHLEILSEN